jgi:hypothetical protein
MNVIMNAITHVSVYSQTLRCHLALDLGVKLGAPPLSLGFVKSSRACLMPVNNPASLLYSKSGTSPAFLNLDGLSAHVRRCHSYPAAATSLL